MKALFSAIRFLTILPAGRDVNFTPEKMIPCFPLTGLILGVLLAGFDMLALRLWPVTVVAVLDVVFLAVLTGMLHIDGLADAADGLLGFMTAERRLSVMKDSRVGAMGLGTVICVLAVKWAGLTAIVENRFLFLLIIPSFARSGMLFGMRYLPYGRPEGGTGQSFFKTPPGMTAFRWILVPVALSFISGWRGILILSVFSAGVMLLLRFYRYRTGCITGDMLGAMTELLEAVLFLAAAAGGS